MRKVRDYDAELKALGNKARALKAKRIEQLGQLVATTGADALDAKTLAGVLLDAIGSKDASAKEAWRAKGAAFFQRSGRKSSGAAAIDGRGRGDDAGDVLALWKRKGAKRNERFRYRGGARTSPRDGFRTRHAC